MGYVIYLGFHFPHPGHCKYGNEELRSIQPIS